jgi:hypothetical protein
MKHCFDEKCLDLARYFYPKAEESRLRDLAQDIQNAVEAEDIEQPKPLVGGLDCGVDLRTGKGICVCGRCSVQPSEPRS